MLALLAGIVAIAQPMNDGHSLTSLWKKYDAAHKADRPQLEAQASRRPCSSTFRWTFTMPLRCM